ncbi:hypothetical protein [Flavobacterium sp. H122]|uniref:hypothetical protein n=1 Tax=Flavobacterium sp. H122 TaxID=2529860 RepID=UPI0010AB2C57|nr:hypothetical protein [Flavobacterium sp. H122]
MKIKSQIYILFILTFLISCKKQNESNNIVDNKNKTSLPDTVKKATIQRDVFINKEYFEQEELLDTKILNFKETSIDSIFYCLYKINNTESYIFSLDKFLKNDELAKYKIIDTVNLKSDKIKVNIEDFSDYKTLNLFLDNKAVKKWKFKTYPKTTKKLAILNSWKNDNIEIHITIDNIFYLFHGQCLYTFPVKILNDNEVELIWGYIGRDCVYDVLFDETFDLPKDKIPQNGKPFSKYTLENNVVKVTYYYNEWLKKYRKKMEENDKPYPFLTSFSIKRE